MENKNRGKVSFTAQGETYTLQYSSNALCRLESALDKPIIEIGEMMADVKKLRLSTVRAVLWAGLVEHHKNMTLDDAGSIIDGINMDGAMDHISEAFGLAFGDKKSSGEHPADPPKPDQQEDGTGPAS